MRQLISSSEKPTAFAELGVAQYTPFNHDHERHKTVLSSDVYKLILKVT